MSATAVFVVVALHSGLVAAPPAPPTATPKTGQVVITEVTAGDPKKGAVFTISVGDCKKAKGLLPEDPAECGVVVALKRGGAGKSRLEWTAKSGPIARPNDNRALIGNPEDKEHQMTLRWSTVVVGNANQKAGINGLLITQETHGEKAKRRHDLFLARGGKMDHAFTAREGRGSKTWSEVSAADVDHDGGAEIVLMLASTNDEEVADTWEMQVYGWRADIAKIIARNDLHPAVKGAVIAMTRTVAEARKMAEDPCARELLVLDNKSADLLGDGQFVLAYPAPTKADAELALEAVRACNPALSGAVKPLANGVDVDSDFSADD
ncbi:MAG: hypothetical protein Q8O67_28430 [Deltaproteobacteria bacterium]|nr:hypothetical protein [Deltaproteobacteria bacterium]